MISGFSVNQLAYYSFCMNSLCSNFEQIFWLAIEDTKNYRMWILGYFYLIEIYFVWKWYKWGVRWTYYLWQWSIEFISLMGVLRALLGVHNEWHVKHDIHGDWQVGHFYFSSRRIIFFSLSNENLFIRNIAELYSS